MNVSLVKKAYLVIVFSIFGKLLYAQDVAIINGKPIDAVEFLWVYKKNNTKETKLTYKELAAYLDLYVNFKLKVAEARVLGLDSEDSYKEEISVYEEALKAQKKSSHQPQDYAFIMNEYREGVLMFNICEQKIWNKVADDDQELKSFFETNAKKYKGKNFEEIRGQVIGDYQQQLEKNWIKDLRSKYTIKINQAELKKLAK